MENPQMSKITRGGIQSVFRSKRGEIPRGGEGIVHGPSKYLTVLGVNGEKSDSS